MGVETRGIRAYPDGQDAPSQLDGSCKLLVGTLTVVSRGTNQGDDPRVDLLLDPPPHLQGH